MLSVRTPIGAPLPHGAENVDEHAHDFAAFAEKFSGAVDVAQLGAPYRLPVQKGPWFGENVIELELADSGRVTKVRYSSSSDAAGALGIVPDALGKEETVLDQINQAKNDADLIYQQQRLVLCQADPVNCPK